MTGDQKDTMKALQSFAVTTSHRPGPGQVEAAIQLALELGVPFAKRQDRSLEVLTLKLGVEGVVVVAANKISCVVGEKEFFFHPGLARLRIMEQKNGKTDQMIKAMSIGKGQSVLDCTLGLGTDAIVTSFVAGAGGRVTGLESSPVIASLVRRGLATYPEPEEDIALAMRRITVVNASHKEYLASLPPCSFDVIYFDPMFRRAIHKSSAMRALRPLARGGSPGLETVNLALRVARRRVVIKERSGSEEFKRLGCLEVSGGKHAPVAYGILEKGMVSG